MAPGDPCILCGQEVNRQNAFETPEGLLCGDCFVRKAASQRKPTGDELKALKKAVKEELAGVLPRERLKELIEEGYRKILIEKQTIEVVAGNMVNDIERLAGVAVSIQVLEVIRALSSTLAGQEDEVRDQKKRIEETL